MPDTLDNSTTYKIGDIITASGMLHIAMIMSESLDKSQQTGYCSTQISLPVKDPNRENVVKLMQAEISAIFDLILTFEGLFE